MHKRHPRGVTAMRAGALSALAALSAACGHRSIEIIEGCEDLAAPACQCQASFEAPVCIELKWYCLPCPPPPSPDAMPSTEAGVPIDSGRDGGAGADAGGAADGGGDAGTGCGDGSALVCRRGCGHRVREWKPTCEGTTWKCAWGGTLEDRSTAAPSCDAGA